MPVWCQDEAGPSQAIPQPGASWVPTGKPAGQPHEYSRGGTAKLLTRFRPATGEVRATGVPSAPNAVRHPWLQATRAQVLAELPAAPQLPVDQPLWVHGAHYLGHAPTAVVPPLRLIRVWATLAGHATPAMIRWLCAHGVLPCSTPLSGSWLTRAESVQRIIVRRA